MLCGAAEPSAPELFADHRDRCSVVGAFVGPESAPPCIGPEPKMEKKSGLTRATDKLFGAL